MSRLSEWLKRFFKPKTPVAPQSPLTAISIAMLESVNEERRIRGRRPLTAHGCLNEQAAIHAKAVAEGRQVVHDGMNGRLFHCGMGFGAENWAPANTVSEAINEWVHSPPHLKNMMVDCRYFGGAIVDGNAVMLVGNLI